MPGQIIRRQKAREDVIDCALKIAEDRPQTAERFLDAVEASLHRLAEFPLAGSRREFLAPALRGIRSWPVAGFETFLIFYYPTDDGVLFSRLLYGARDLETALGEE